MWEKVGSLLMAILVIFVIIGLPFAIISSLNTLFNLSIPRNFETWWAAMLLFGIFMMPSFCSSTNKK
jgi:polyferredoxin